MPYTNLYLLHIWIFFFELINWYYSLFSVFSLLKAFFPTVKFFFVKIQNSIFFFGIVPTCYSHIWLFSLYKSRIAAAILLFFSIAVSMKKNKTEDNDAIKIIIDHIQDSIILTCQFCIFCLPNWRFMWIFYHGVEKSKKCFNFVFQFLYSLAFNKFGLLDEGKILNVNKVQLFVLSHKIKKIYVVNLIVLLYFFFCFSFGVRYSFLISD